MSSQRVLQFPRQGGIAFHLAARALGNVWLTYDVRSWATEHGRVARDS